MSFFDEFDGDGEHPITDELLDLFPFPTAVIAGVDAMSELFSSPLLKKGLYPIILGEQFSADRVADIFRHHSTFPADGEIEQIIEMGRRITPNIFLKAWASEHVGQSSDRPERPESRAWVSSVNGEVVEPTSRVAAIDSDAVYVNGFRRGKWSKSIPVVPENEIRIDAHLTIEGEPFQEILMAYLPISIDEGWKAAAHLRYDSPPDVSPQHHVGMAFDWAKKYGARPISFKYNMVHYLVDQPVMDRDEALELAKAHYAYCWWSNAHGDSTLEEIAEGILGSRVWEFYWT